MLIAIGVSLCLGPFSGQSQEVCLILNRKFILSPQLQSNTTGFFLFSSQSIFLSLFSHIENLVFNPTSIYLLICSSLQYTQYIRITVSVPLPTTNLPIKFQIVCSAFFLSLEYSPLKVKRSVKKTFSFVTT